MPPRSPSRSRSPRVVVVMVAAIALLVSAALVLRSRFGVGAAARSTLVFRAAGTPRECREDLLSCDVDGDGKADFIRSMMPVTQVWISRGDGDFDTVPFPFSGPIIVPLVLADLDHDRRCDFVLPAQPRRTLLVSQWDFVKPTGEYPVDHDAVPAPHQPPDGGVLRKQEGVFRSTVFKETDFDVRGPDVGVNLLAGDFDGDGAMDLLAQPTRDLPPPTEDPDAALSAAGTAWPLFYDPRRGYFASKQAAASAPDSTETTTPSFADLDYAFSAPTTRVVHLAHGSAFHGARTRLLTGDFNGDGRTDFIRQDLAAPPPNGVPAALLYTSTDGGFLVTPIRATNATPRIDTALAGDAVRLSIADFNGDGKADLLWQRYAGDVPRTKQGEAATLQIWLSSAAGGGSNDGLGEFYVSEPAGLDPAWRGADYHFYAGDFDGDGRADLMVEDRREPAHVTPMRQLAPAADEAR